MDMKSRTFKAIMIAILLLGTLPAASRGADEPSAKEKAALFLRGAKLWPVYCNYCHKARPGSEFSPVQWDTVMAHMRLKSNLPPEDLRAILQYLKAR
jgi:hypothetical protein